jgi:hypothetical protein
LIVVPSNPFSATSDRVAPRILSRVSSPALYRIRETVDRIPNAGRHAYVTYCITFGPAAIPFL